MRLSDILKARNAVIKINKVDLKPKTAVKLIRLVKEVESHLSEAEEIRKQLITKHGTTNPETKTSEVKPEDPGFKQFFIDYEEALETEVSMKSELISLEELGDVEMSAEDLAVLEGIVFSFH